MKIPKKHVKNGFDLGEINNWGILLVSSHDGRNFPDGSGQRKPRCLEKMIRVPWITIGRGRKRGQCLTQWWHRLKNNCAVFKRINEEKGQPLREKKNNKGSLIFSFQQNLQLDLKIKFKKCKIEEKLTHICLCSSEKQNPEDTYLYIVI